jgi:hypothetical protein
MKIIYSIIIINIALMMTSCGRIPQQKCFNSQQWENSIYNKDNAEFVEEVAFNEDVLPSEVTQEMFDHRYSSGY